MKQYHNHYIVVNYPQNKPEQVLEATLERDPTTNVVTKGDFGLKAATFKQFESLAKAGNCGGRPFDSIVLMYGGEFDPTKDHVSGGQVLQRFDARSKKTWTNDELAKLVGKPPLTTPFVENRENIMP